MDRALRWSWVRWLWLAFALAGCDCAGGAGAGAISLGDASRTDGGAAREGGPEGGGAGGAAAGTCGPPPEAGGPVHGASWNVGGVESRAFDVGYSVAVDRRGFVYVSGQFEGTADFGDGPQTAVGAQDVFVASFDADGVPRWSTTFGSRSTDRGFGIVVDSAGNATVAGAFGAAGNTIDFGGGTLTAEGSPDVFVASYDDTGAHRWSHRFGSASGSNRAHGIAIDASGHVYVTGYFIDRASFGGPELVGGEAESAMFVASFDAGGVHQWSRAFTGTDFVRGRGIAATAEGRVYVAGWFRGEVDFGGGVHTSASNANADGFVVALDETGAHRWSHGFGDTGVDVGYDPAIAPGEEEVYLAGTFEGSVDLGGGVLTAMGRSDVLVAAFDATGTHRWSTQHGYEGQDVGIDVATAAGQGVFVTGRMQGTADGACDGYATRDAAAFVLHLGFDGAERWLTLFDGPGPDWGEGIAMGPGGTSVFATGVFTDGLDFGGGPLRTAGAADAFVLRLEP